MKHILEFDQFLLELEEAYPGDRMAAKDPMYWSRRPSSERVAGVQSYINRLKRGDMFEYYTSGGTTIGVFLKADGSHVHYYAFPDVDALILRKDDNKLAGEFNKKVAKMKIDRIGGVGAVSKDELEDMEKEYNEAIKNKFLNPRERWVKEWFNMLKFGMKKALRYK